MDISICISNGKEQSISLINGIWVQKGGTHITWLQNLIVNYAKPKVEKILKKVNLNLILTLLLIIYLF